MNAKLEEAIRRINGFRREHKLATLLPHPGLMKVAEDHARAMRDGDFLDHRHFEQRIGDDWDRAGEVVSNADLPIDSPMNTVLGWMNSPHHRENLLGDYKFIGIARSASGTRAWWRADLGA